MDEPRRRHSRSMHLDDPQFPPLLKGHAVRAPRKPYAEACRLAQIRELGAGDVVWGRSTGRAELAVVLEPEVALERALQMGPLLMVALGDCLGSLCPPKVAVQYRWPRRHPAQRRDGRRGAHRRTPHVPLSEQPRGSSSGATLDIAAPRAERQEWSKTSLTEEAGADITRTDIVQSLAAHFLVWLNTWEEEGFRPVHDQWLFRAEGRAGTEPRCCMAMRMSRVKSWASMRAPISCSPTDGGKVRTLSFIDSVDLIEARTRHEAAQDHPLRCVRRARLRAGCGAGGMGGVGRLCLCRARPRDNRRQASQAFANGFLGFRVSAARPLRPWPRPRPDLEAVERALASHFVAAHGAPGLDAALPAAKEEARSFSTCAATRRSTPFHRAPHVGRGRPDQGGVPDLRPPAGEPLHAKVWTVVDE